MLVVLFFVQYYKMNLGFVTLNKQFDDDDDDDDDDDHGENWRACHTCLT